MMKFDYTDDMLEEMNETVRRHVQENYDLVRAEDCGLDKRCGQFYISDSYIAVEGDGHRLDYYGGFEYVSGDDVVVMGDWKFYSSFHERVKETIHYWKEKEEEEEEEE